MSRIIYTAGLLVTGSNDVTIAGNLTVNKTISGSGELYFSASNGEPYYRMVLYDTGSGKLFMTSSFSQISVAGNPGGSDTQIQFNDGGVFTGSNNFTFDSSTNTVNLTGDLNVTGDISAKGPNRSIQFNDAGNLSGSSVLSFNKTNDTLEMTGSTILLASEASALSMEMNESASFEFLTGAANSGSFIVQTSPDTGKGALQSYFGQGTGTVFGQPLPNQAFGIKYTSGSSASEGELTMVIGKRDLTNLGGANQNNFYVAYEPGGTFTNAQGELEFFVGEHLNVGSGVLSVFRGGASAVTQTSSFAGYFSSSAFANQQRHTRPFALSTSASVDDTNPAFVINKDHTDLTSDNLLIDYGGNIHTDGRLIFRSDVANEISASGRLNITTTGNQIALQADGGTGIILKAGGNNTLLSAVSESFSNGPGTFNRVINKGAIIAEDGHVSTMDTSSLREAPAAAGNQLDHRGHVLTKVGSGTAMPKGAIVALTGSSWSVANSGSGACASSSLAINLQASSGDGPFLMQGIVNLSYAPGDRVGQLLYLGDNGSASAVPPSNTAHYSLPIGYYLGGSSIYFSPDRTTGGTDTVLDTISPYEDGTGPGDIQPKAGNNVASGSFSTVGGGQDNEAFGHNNFIAGGSGSIAKGTGNVILGGFANSISGSSTFSVVAGSNNVIDTLSGGSSIVTGLGNTLTGVLADGIVMTGQGNSSLSKGSVVFGLNNTISGEAYYYHVGGINNTISGTETLKTNPGAIMGGGSNTLGTIVGQGQMIIGGLSNTVAGYTGNSTILQGENNIIDDALQPTQQFNKTYLLILNGKDNEITGSALANTGVGAKDKSGKFSTIMNGEANRIETGGTGTGTFYKHNTILNGSNNLVSGSGVTSGVSGMYNTIVNGDNNIIGADISGSTIAAGSNITADRSDTVFAANLSLTNLPTSDTGLPVGAVYRSGDTLKIVT